MPLLFVSVLGGFEARIRSRHAQTLTFPTRKSEALLAYLATLSDFRHRREQLTELLWGDVPSAQGRHSLRQTLTDIRAALGPDAHHLLRTSEDTVELAPGKVWLDADVLEAMIRRRSRRSVEAACSLYRGDFLAGFNVREAQFEAWLNVERTRFKQRAIEAYETHVRSLMAARSITEAIQSALRLAALDPLQEWVHRALMTLYAQRGQFGAALAQYEHCAQLLARELGIHPEAETERVRRELLISRNRTSALERRGILSAVPPTRRGASGPPERPHKISSTRLPLRKRKIDK